MGKILSAVPCWHVGDVWGLTKSLTQGGYSMSRILTHSALLATLVFLGARDSLAACTACVISTGKCYTWKSISCKELKANLTTKAAAGITCTDALEVVVGKKTSTAKGFSVPSEVGEKATTVLLEAGVAVVGAMPSSDPRRTLIIVDESSLNAASDVLRRSAIAVKAEPAPEQTTPGGTTAGRKVGGQPGADARVNNELENAAGNQQAQAALTTNTKLGTGNGPYRPPPPPVQADAAGVVNRGGSNIKNNLQMPLNVTGAICNGTGSVSVTTNYAPPQGSIWVFSNLTTKKAIATLDQPNQSANTFQFPVDASKGNVSLVIENSLASAITSPYAIECNSPASTATPQALGTPAVSSRAVSTKGISGSDITPNPANAPAACPNLTFTESSRATNVVVGANTLLVLTNDGPGTALNVTVTRMSCDDGFTYTPPNGFPTIPFVVPGAANLAQGASTKFSAFFKKPGNVQTGSFSCTITYTEGKSCPSRTATVSIR
jgi:hypothetical protein